MRVELSQITKTVQKPHLSSLDPFFQPYIFKTFHVKIYFFFAQNLISTYKKPFLGTIVGWNWKWYLGIAL